ncbi:MAG: cache domain-containing protein, partial [Elusimicrobiota bacterium]|nr:cache domain-containing protein [Elusimicrobiota bacterium]
MATGVAELRGLKRRLTAAFLVLAAAIAAGGFFYYRGYRAALLRDAENLLRSVTVFKAAQIKYWRADNLERVDSLIDSPVLGASLAKFAAAPADRENAALLRARLEKFNHYNHFKRALLTDKDGKILLAAGGGDRGLCPDALRLLKSAAGGGKARMGDIHPHPGTGVHGIHIAARAARSPTGAGLFLVLSIDPGKYLYPLVQQWPAYSPSAETLLARREGADVLYLNELRHVKGSALKLRFPVSSGLPVAAAARGQRGLLRGRDYRGVKVTAYADYIAETGWLLVNKVDEAEALAAAGGGDRGL